MSETEFDLLIVGGGINGCGIARDAAGRGLSVLLVERDDLAGHTSSASSKLIHGGLRYLEQLEFRLVRESLTERESLLRAAPHIVRPQEFIVPLIRSSRPAWMIRGGLFLYDRLAGREILPASRSVRLDRDPIGQGLKPDAAQAFTYWDCRVQDSRLVVLNALDANERGAAILTRTELVEARRDGKHWLATIRDRLGDRAVTARALVNAAGPWAEHLFGRLRGVERRRSIRLVKGSHIVLPSLYPGAHAFLLQNPDRRVVFAIPFEDRFTLVGTTDVEWNGPPAEPSIDDVEIDYLLDTVRRNFTASVSRGDIAWSYSGIRALVDDRASDPSKITRDYVLDLDGSAPDAPLLSVFGGKITTYRRLAEQALDKLAPFLPAGRRWTEHAVLPGGDITDLDVSNFASELVSEYPALPEALLQRFAHTYGTRTHVLLEGVRSTASLGEEFGAGLTAREVDYLVSKEWAQTADDILYRRTKLGLSAPTSTADRLSEYLSRGG